MSTPMPGLAALVRAELDKLAHRTSSRIGIALVAAIAVLVPIGMLLVQMQFKLDPEAVAEGAKPFAFAGGTGVQMVLAARNFFVFRAMIIAVVAVSFAGEFVGRTLREDLVRPVSRSQVLLAKWIALQAFVLVGAVVPLVISLPLSALLFGTEEITSSLSGYALVWVGDTGFATMVAAISLTIRSVPGTIGGVFLYWVVDQALGWALWAGEGLRPFLAGYAKQANALQMMESVDRVLALRAWLPSSAFNLYWDVVPGEPFPWQGAASLALLTAASYAWAWWWFHRVDVD